MDASLSPEQELLVETAQHLGARLSSLNSDAEPQGWNRVQEAGWSTLRRRNNGRPYATGVEVGLLAEALGGHLVGEPVLGTILASELLELSAASQEVLDEATLGEQVTVPVLNAALTAVASGGMGTAWDAAGARRGVVLHDGAVALVDLDAATPMDAADPSRHLLRMSWAADAASPVGRCSSEALMRWSALALSALACELVGVMEAALHLAVTHAKDRTQFGRPIATFQAVQHICADQVVSIEAARSSAYSAAWAVDALPPADALLACRVAKVYCGQAARRVAEAVIQVHGGIGMTWECNAHRYLRRVLVDQQVMGTDAAHLAAIAEERTGHAA